VIERALHRLSAIYRALFDSGCQTCCN